MRILDRLVAFTFLRLFLVSILATPPLFILGDVTENLDRYLDRGLTGAQVAAAYLWQLPLYVQWSFPIAGLIAAVFTVHNMTLHREVVAAKAGGVSFHRLFLPVLVGGALAVFFLLLISLSEHLGFASAYTIAAGACVALLGHYVRHMLRSARLGAAFGAALALLYGLLYVLLRSEDHALIMGSLLVFASLAVAMIATRKVDWYAVGNPAPGGKAA